MLQHSLDSVWIDGFRGLRNLSLDGLGPLNILVGENNCGKTSVLEAISILCNPYHPYEWLAMVRRRDFGGLDETRVQSLRWCFRQTGQLVDPEFTFDGHCEMTCMGKFPLRKLTVEYKDIVGEPSAKDLERMRRLRPPSRTSLELEEEWRGAEITHYAEFDSKASEGVLLQPDTTCKIEPIVMQVWEEDYMIGRFGRPQRKGGLATDTLTPYSYQLNRLQLRSHSLASLVTSEEGRLNVVKLITEFDADILDIEVLSLRGRAPAIYLRHKTLGPAPLSVFGDALRRAVLLASTLQRLKGGGILLIDELETGIHVSALAGVFAWLANAAQQLNVQVIATTHSLEAVDAIAQSVTDRIDDLVTFHLKQTERETIARRIPGELLLRLRCESGLDVR